MLVQVEHLDGSITTPLYDPEHAAAVWSIYYAKLKAGEITSYQVLDKGKKNEK